MNTQTPPANRLTDEQVRKFITDGYLCFQADMPGSYYADLHRDLDAVLARNDGHEGNNVLPLVPQMQQVFEHANVRGALGSLLGPGYIMHPHRYLHVNRDKKQWSWHQDQFCGAVRHIRSHRPWWVIFMFYPHVVTPQDGPTAVLPGRQYQRRRDHDHDRDGRQVCGEAGTCFLIHFDAWHSASPKLSAGGRHMLKFDFGRVEMPVRTGGRSDKAGIAAMPSWDCHDDHWHNPDETDVPYGHRLIWREQWHWLRGDPDGRGDPAGDDDGLLGRCVTDLGSSDPTVRARAADALGLMGEGAADAVDRLIRMLADEYDPAAVNAAYALGAIGQAAAPALGAVLRQEDPHLSLLAARGLAIGGRAAIRFLAEAMAHENENVRDHAAFALGESCLATGEVIEALVKGASDSAWTVRVSAIDALGKKGAAGKPAVLPMMAALRETKVAPRDRTTVHGSITSVAALALCRLGTAAEAATDELRDALHHPTDRYARGFAVEALHRIGTSRALSILIPHLKSTRMCAVCDRQNGSY